MRSTLHRFSATCLLLAGIAALAHMPAQAGIGEPYDTPTLSCVASGETEITLKVTAGSSGAPAGVTIQWMTQDDYNLYGWGSASICALSLSGQPSYTGNTTTRWELGPNEFFEIHVGSLNLFETGLSVHGDGCDGDLVCGTTYVFRVFAHATSEHKRSAFSSNTECTTADCPSNDCTLTIGGYGQNGPGDCDQGGDGKNFWPMAVLALGPDMIAGNADDNTMKLGSVSYTLAELCAILGNGEGGNCLRQLARQLVAAKFNAMWGADCAFGLDAIDAAEAEIGAKHINPTVGSPSGSGCGTINAIQSDLNLFNNGYTAGGCEAHCADGPQLRLGEENKATTPTTKSSWGSLKLFHR
jgi:hypothetical protein